MASFNLDRLFVTMVPPTNAWQPVEGRKYTLTHSDTTGQLFLTIGYEFDYEAMNIQTRDEVLAQWQRISSTPISLAGNVYIDGGEYSEEMSKRRLDIFKREMNVALKGMIYGDWPFYNNYPSLLNCPIHIHFSSNYPQFRQTLYFGTPRHYLENNE